MSAQLAFIWKDEERDFQEQLNELLPDGWRLKWDSDDRLIVFSSTNTEYLVTKTELYPWKTCPQGGNGVTGSALKPGQRYVDTRQPLRIKDLPPPKKKRPPFRQWGRYNLFPKMLLTKFGKGLNHELLLALIEREVEGKWFIQEESESEKVRLAETMQLTSQKIARLREKIEHAKGKEGATKIMLKHENAIAQHRDEIGHLTLDGRDWAFLHVVNFLQEIHRRLPSVSEVEETIRAVLGGEGDPQRHKELQAAIAIYRSSRPIFSGVKFEDLFSQELFKRHFSTNDFQIRRMRKKWSLPLPDGR